MMVVPAGVRVLVASRPVDFRNYAEHRIMRSPRREIIRVGHDINELSATDPAFQSA
jgi:hypothetical protein